MRVEVECPLCSTRYAFETDQLSSKMGGSVQCSKCKHIWYYGQRAVETQTQVHVEPVAPPPAGAPVAVVPAAPVPIVPVPAPSALPEAVSQLQATQRDPVLERRVGSLEESVDLLKKGIKVPGESGEVTQTAAAPKEKKKKKTSKATSSDKEGQTRSRARRKGSKKEHNGQGGEHDASSSKLSINSDTYNAYQTQLHMHTPEGGGELNPAVFMHGFDTRLDALEERVTHLEEHDLHLHTYDELADSGVGEHEPDFHPEDGDDDALFAHGDEALHEAALYPDGYAQHDMSHGAQVAMEEEEEEPQAQEESEPEPEEAPQEQEEEHKEKEKEEEEEMPQPQEEPQTEDDQLVDMLMGGGMAAQGAAESEKGEGGNGGAASPAPVTPEATGENEVDALARLFGVAQTEEAAAPAPVVAEPTAAEATTPPPAEAAAPVALAPPPLPTPEVAPPPVPAVEGAVVAPEAAPSAVETPAPPPIVATPVAAAEVAPAVPPLAVEQQAPTPEVVPAVAPPAPPVAAAPALAPAPAPLQPDAPLPPGHMGRIAADGKNPFLILDGRIKRIKDAPPVPEKSQSSGVFVLLFMLIVLIAVSCIAFIGLAPEIAERYLPVSVVEPVRKMIASLLKMI